MIIVRIWEGLGNQLFQYAYARSLQERMGIPVYLDVRHCNRGDLPFEEKNSVNRKIGLQHFNISMKCADTNKIFSLRCLNGENTWKRAGYFLLQNNVGKWNYISDDGRVTEACTDLMEPKSFTYVNAHCINPGYYQQYRDILLPELQLKRKVKISAELERILENENTVSLHIRLTDYLKTPSSICRQKYYDEAMEFIKKRVNNPWFVIFTDDLDAAKCKYKFNGNIIWMEKGKYKDYEELSIMSKCQHNIIAESTFSYWGAWLNKNEEKIVVVPRKWFSRNVFDRDWVRI